MTDPTLPIVVIGTGMAGYSLVRQLRQLDASAPILMLTRDDGDSYAKPLLSTGFSRGQTGATLAMADAGRMAQQLNVAIRCFTEVTGIDPSRHQIQLGSEVLSYKQLVLATGAQVNKLVFPGSEHPAILSVNSLLDYRLLRERLAGKRRVLIMGAGLIGCEFANDLLKGGFQVALVDPAEVALLGLLPEFAGLAVMQELTRAGVTFHMQRKVVEVGDRDGQIRVTLDDGIQLETDLIISAVGLRPNLKLAKTADLLCNQGIVVNRYLETSQADIYALGDCAEVDGHVLLYVQPLLAAAEALAKTLSGTTTQVHYGVMPIVVKTPACPVLVCPPSRAQEYQGDWQGEQENSDIRATFVNNQGETLGFVLTGKYVKEKQQFIKLVKGIHH